MEDTIDPEDIERVIKEAINETLHQTDATNQRVEVVFNSEKVENWSNAVMDKCLQQLVKRQSKFKFAVTCIFMQKNGAGMTTAGTAYWEAQDSDCMVTVPWENNTIHCIVTIYACKAFPSYNDDGPPGMG